MDSGKGSEGSGGRHLPKTSLCFCGFLFLGNASIIGQHCSWAMPPSSVSIAPANLQSKNVVLPSGASSGCLLEDVSVCGDHWVYHSHTAVTNLPSQRRLCDPSALASIRSALTLDDYQPDDSVGLHLPDMDRSRCHSQPVGFSKTSQVVLSRRSGKQQTPDTLRMKEIGGAKWMRRSVVRPTRHSIPKVC